MAGPFKTPDNYRAKPGPKEDRVKIEGDWEDAVGTALKKERPKEGWPKQDDQPGKAKKQ